VSLLEKLRGMTTVVADTGDIESIGQYRPRDATTNPSLICKAAQMEQYQHLIQDAVNRSREVTQDSSGRMARCLDMLGVNFGKAILAIVPGRVSTEVDSRLSFDTEATIARAHQLIALYEAADIPRERVLIKIASTWEGIQAARQLETEGIHCNLTLLFGLHQAVACAEAGVTLISPFVGRIFDWYVETTGEQFEGPDDPGVQSVTTIYNYFKKFDFDTQVMGASFRNIGQIEELAGCDLLTISPTLLAELQDAKRELTRKLDPAIAKRSELARITMNRQVFDEMHRENQMASAKLKEGIEGFTKAQVQLEDLLKPRLDRAWS